MLLHNFRIKYEINLESVSVNGHTLPINQSILRQGRTIVDSGTTFAYLARGAFLHLLDAVSTTLFCVNTFDKIFE